MSGLPQALRDLSPSELEVAFELIAEAGELREREGLAPLEGWHVRRAAQAARDWTRLQAAIDAGDADLERKIRLSIREAETLLFQPRRPTAAQLKAAKEADEKTEQKPDEGDFGALDERRLRAVK